MKYLLLFLLLASLLGCREAVVHDLNEQDANRALSSLVSAGINADKVRQADGRWAIEVSEAQVLPAVRFLEENSVLRISTRTAHESGSLVTSRDEERHTHEVALAQELEQTMQSIPGVLGARVHLNLPALDPLWGNPSKGSLGSASVLVVMRENGSLSKEQITTLVAGAAGVAREQVSVVLTFKEVFAGGSAKIVAQIPENLSGPSSGIVSFNSDSRLLWLSGILLIASGIGLAFAGAKWGKRSSVMQS